MTGSKSSSPVKRLIRCICKISLFFSVAILGTSSLSMRDVTYPVKAGDKDPTADVVIMIIVDSLSLKDINCNMMPNLTKLAKEGAIGLMNGRTAKSQQPDHAYITIGAGSRGQGSNQTGHAFNVDEDFMGVKASEVYVRNTNEPEPPKGSVVHPYIASIIKANADLLYETIPGALGEALSRAGKRTAVFGNSDTLSDPCRYAVSIAMDSKGFVDIGDIGYFATIKKPDFPGGLISNTRYLSEKTRYALGFGGRNVRKADLIIIESGDTARIEKFRRSGAITMGAYSSARRKALISVDTLIGDILESTDLKNSVVMVVVPTPDQDGIKAGHLLTPMVIAGQGFTGGMLTSQSTRRHGLVTNMDIAATVLGILGVEKPPWILGSFMVCNPDFLSIQNTERLLQRISYISSIRGIYLKTYISLLVIFVLGIPFFITIKANIKSRMRVKTGAGKVKGEDRKILSVASYILLALGSVPFLWLVLPTLLFPFQVDFPTFLANPVHLFFSIPVGILTIIILIFILIVLEIGFRTFEHRFIVVCLITGTGVILDALAGSGLMKHSILGYDPIVGARFYGIGNEYMGVLIGSLIAGLGLLLDYINIHAGIWARKAYKHEAKWIIGFTFLLGLTVLALPGVGANLGGTCTAVAGFGTAYILFFRRSITWSQGVNLFGLSILIILILALIDAYLKCGPLSHWGRTLLYVNKSGIRVILDTARRKASMNLKLIRHTIWTKAFLVFIIVLVFVRIRPHGLAGKIFARYPGFKAGLSACLVASGVSLVTNDSGIVSAALIIMYPALIFLGLAWREVI